MALISARNLGIAFGGPDLFDDLGLQVRKGDRIGLLGRNGTGKSTLLALLAGTIEPDTGVVERKQGLRLATLPQEPPPGMSGTAGEYVAAAQIEGHNTAALFLDRLAIPVDAPVETLSGGMLRRTLLARALAAEPDVLILDEPTNHLDLDIVEWMEEHLRRTAPTLVFVTHDRALLRVLATRIVELDRGRLLEFPGGYDAFLRHREQALQAEAQALEKFDKKIAQEEIWIRKGIKARRTRNEGRVRALKQMREERRSIRPEAGTAQLNLAESGRGGRLVLEAKDLTFGFGTEPIIRAFSTTILRGDRIGVIGPNGAGKTTLLKLLLGDLAPQTGTVRHGTGLQVLYYDQLREQLDPNRSVRENLDLPADTVTSGGRNQHVMSYLQDFLFTPDRARQPARALSGGERNRLLLARLFTREANVLVLDEPTNDLDLETLDLLEELLSDFKGTLLLVSHDRTLLDRIVTSTLAVPGDGTVIETIGGYAEWRSKQAALQVEASGRKAPASKKKVSQVADRPLKLSYREKQEAAALPGQIEILEEELENIRSRLGDPALYREAGAEVANLKVRLEAVEVELEGLYARWEELDARQG